MGITNFDIVQANSFIGPVAMVPGARVVYLNNSTTGLADGAIGGSDGNDGLSPLRPKSTIAGALAACTAGRGDIIFVAPNHSETLTAVTTVTKSDVQIVGIQVGNKRPTFTINGTVDLFSLEASGILLANLKLTIVTTDNATALVNVAAANCVLYNLQLIPSATAVNVVDCITLASGADDCWIEKVDIRNTTVAVVSFVEFEAAVARPTIKDCFFFGNVTTGGIIDAAAATQVRIQNNIIGTIGTTIPAVILDSNPTGVMAYNYLAGTHTTLASNAQYGNALRLAENYVSEETNASAQGVLSPAADVD